jgi:hypothetical protein
MPLTHYSKFSMITLRIWVFKSGVIKNKYSFSVSMVRRRISEAQIWQIIILESKLSVTYYVLIYQRVFNFFLCVYLPFNLFNMSVADECYFRNASCALISISTILHYNAVVSIWMKGGNSRLGKWYFHSNKKVDIELSAHDAFLK